MEYVQFIQEKALILVPALYVVGLFLKASEIKDKYIPITILTLGIIASVFLLGKSLGVIPAIIQGILTAGTATFIHQLAKQTIKKE